MRRPLIPLLAAGIVLALPVIALSGAPAGLAAVRAEPEPVVDEPAAEEETLFDNPERYPGPSDAGWSYDLTGETCEATDVDKIDWATTDCVASDDDSTPESAVMTEYADADEVWLDEEAGDTLDYEESLAEPPDVAHPLERGFNTGQQVGWAEQDLNMSLDKMVEARATVHRLFIYWADVQPNNGRSFSWTKYDRVVEAAAARHLRLILTPTGSPNWARNRNRRENVDAQFYVFHHPDRLTAWNVFIRELTRHYRSYSPAYEIWNEPNHRNFWEVPWIRNGQSPGGWKELYCRAARVIRANQPGAVVGGPGFAPVATTVRYKKTRPGTYLKRALAHGLRSCGVGFVGFHPYVIDAYCNHNPPFNRNLPTFRVLARLRGVLRSRDLDSVQIWQTEWGFPSKDYPGGSNVTCHYTESKQATLVGNEQALLASIRYTPNSMYFNIRDAADCFDEDTWCRDAFRSIGLLRRSYAVKPSFEAFASGP